MRTAFAIVVALFALIGAGVPMFMHPQRSYIGTTTVPRFGGVAVLATVDPDSPAARAGLRPGDSIGCASFRDLAQLSGDRSTAYAGEATMHLCIERAGVTRAIDVHPVVTAPSAPLYGNDAWAAVRLAIYAIVIGCGVLLIYGRPGRMSWLFFLFALGTSPAASGFDNLTSLPSVWYEAYVLLFQTFAQSSSGFLLLFALLVPDDDPTGLRALAFRIAAGATALAFVFYGTAIAGLRVIDPPFAINVPELALVLCTILTVVIRIVTMPQGERSRFNWAAFGIAFGVFAIAVTHGDIRIFATLPVPASMLSVVMPATMLYAVLRKHFIDVRFVLSRTLVFAALSTLVVSAIGFVDWLAAQYLHESRVATIVDAIVTIGLALILHRLYAWFEHAAEFLLFRDRYEAESYLQRVAHSLPVAQRAETIDAELVDAPYDRLSLSGSALYTFESGGFRARRVAGALACSNVVDEDGELIRFLKTQHGSVHLSSLREGAIPAIAIALHRGRRLDGFALYGYHRNGTALDPDEIDVLERLCDAAARAYVNIELERYERAKAAVPAPAT